MGSLRPGQTNKYRKFYTYHAMNWERIKWAHRKGAAWFDFTGYRVMLMKIIHFLDCIILNKALAAIMWPLSVNGINRSPQPFIGYGKRLAPLSYLTASTLFAVNPKLKPLYRLCKAAFYTG